MRSEPDLYYLNRLFENKTRPFVYSREHGETVKKLQMDYCWLMLDVTDGPQYEDIRRNNVRKLRNFINNIEL